MDIDRPTRPLLVLGGAAILVSFVVFAVAHVLHPAETHAHADGASLMHIAAAPGWTAIHLLFIVGTLLYLPYFGMLGAMAPSWGRVLMPAVVVAVGMDVLVFVVEGGVWRSLAEAYVADPEGGAIMASFTAARVGVAWAMLVGGVLWGLATLLLAGRAGATGALPKWLAALGVLAGTMVLVGRIATFMTDRAPWTFAIQGSPTALWELGLGFWAIRTAWRRGSGHVGPTTATSQTLQG